VENLFDERSPLGNRCRGGERCVRKLPQLGIVKDEEGALRG
jgi:hypothetical protein